MYPSKKNYQNAVLVQIIDEKNNMPIRMFWTQEPEAFLKMYTFMEANEIDINITEDDFENSNDDPYLDLIGTIVDIEFNTGGKYSFNCIKVFVELRDYK